MSTSNSYDWKLNRDQVITAALRKLAVIPSGGTPSTNQVNDGSSALNAVLKAFHADGMPLWVIQNKTFTVASGTSQYNIGIGLTINAPQPLKVLQARYMPSGSNTTPMQVYNRYDMNLLPNTTSGTPVILYYQPLDTYGQITLWPTPADSLTQITIDYQRPFMDMDAAADDLDFPNYWTQAIIYNLAWALAPEYGIPPTDRNILAQEAKYFHEQALSFGSEESSVFFQPSTKGNY